MSPRPTWATKVTQRSSGERQKFPLELHEELLVHSTLTYNLEETLKALKTAASRGRCGRTEPSSAIVSAG